jgi:hypothetical protein
VTPAAAIDALDRQCAQHGQDVVLQRFSTDSEGLQSITAEATCRAIVQGGGAPQELVPMPGEAPNTKIIMSPTGLVAAMWPGLPAKDDRILIEGVPNNIEIVDPRSIDNQLVRIELQART